MLASMRLLESVGTDAVEARILALAALTRAELLARGMTVINPHDGETRSGIVAFRHPSLANETVETELVKAKIVCAVRCGNVRFAPHAYTTEADISTAVVAIPA